MIKNKFLPGDEKKFNDQIRQSSLAFISAIKEEGEGYLKASYAFARLVRTIPSLIITGVNHDLKIFRGRRDKGINKLDRNKRQTYSYPPSRFLGIGRANIPGVPIFYSSIDPHTVISECFQEKEGVNSLDNKLYIGTWALKPGQSLNLVAIFSMDETTGITYEFGQHWLKKMDPYFAVLSPENKKLFFSALGKVHELFLSRNNSALEITSRIAHHQVYNLPRGTGIAVDGIIYPSVRKDKKSLNFALKPSSIDSKFELTEVHHFAVSENSSKGAHCDLISMARPKGNFIQWYRYSPFDNITYGPVYLKTESHDEKPMQAPKFYLNGTPINFKEYLNKKIEENRQKVSSAFYDEFEQFQKSEQVSKGLDIKFLQKTLEVEDNGRRESIEQVRIGITAKNAFKPDIA